MQTFTFPAKSPSIFNYRSTSPDKYQQTPSQDVQLRSPEKPDPEQLKPNPHPYAIKTTSTALLSRSNSSSSKHTKHHYIPLTPPSNNKRHRTSSSVSSVEIPRPLPIPPPSPSPSDSEENGNLHTGPPPAHQPRRLKRSETVFTSGTPPPSTTAPLTLEDLPPNPKQWTPSQLSVYLATALRVTGGGPSELPAPIANDIANFMRERKISGKVFLRLGEEELEEYGMNKLWRTALLSTSRNLRQNVLKGRIWGFSDNDSDNGDSSPPPPGLHETSAPSPFPAKDEDETTPNNRKTIFIQRPMYSSAESGSSVEDLSESQSSSPLNLPLLPTSISDGTGSARFKSISKGSTRAKGGRTGRFLTSSDFFEPPEQYTGLPGEKSPAGFGFPPTGDRHAKGRVKGMAKGFERIASVDEGTSDSEPSPSPIEERSDVLSSPTHSRMLSGESKGRILRDMELLKQRGRVKLERERRTSMSSESEVGSPNKIRMAVDLPVESPTKMYAHEEEDDHHMVTTVKANHTGPAIPTWDFEPYPMVKKHDTGSSTSSASSSSSRPLPLPPGPPPASLPPPNLPIKGTVTISTHPFNITSPMPTPPPSAGGPADDELTVEELLALEGAGDSVRRKGKGKGKEQQKRVGVHAWEDEDDDGEGEGAIGFITVKRVPTRPNVVSPSLSSPMPSVLSPVNPAALSIPLPKSRAASSSPLAPDMANAKRVITPIVATDILPSRKITPIPPQVVSPMRVTTELPPLSVDGSGMGLVHPKPVTVVEREVTNSAGIDTVGRMEEIVRREQQIAEQREMAAVVRPLPTPPADKSSLIAPLTAITLPQPQPQPQPEGSAVEGKEEQVAVAQYGKTMEQEELEDEQELRALIADVLKTRSQVEAMKKRLGEVEKNVEELKREVAEAEAKYNFDTPRKSPTPLPEESKDDDVAPATSAADKARRFLFSNLDFTPGGFGSPTSRYANPQSVIDLPPYIALVGLGVCMVVAKVLLKKRGR
ncbi:hypothetical protein E1B28_011842 [Marasmius oreades]|uniref:Uncharacterized protein n=1 Tax=Marasmius oreades TaxID=181124 RepID=A0A9P7UQD6_9AGAR|nr:uncharacterized protein E1B28_011842 [Marasmius oreades]KAG7090243.1 hypothetical protein E1B28_011842 [Marasmius oreades]